MVRAYRYKEGLEDGLLTKGFVDSSIQILPFMDTEMGPMIVTEDDYIIQDAIGSRVMNKEEFERKYEISNERF